MTTDMMKKTPGIAKMIRAPFLSSIIAPIVPGTLLALSINGHLNVLAFAVVLIIGVGQNLAFHPQVLWLMPATGLSTSSILLAGQMIDLDADREGGKHGVASRMGTRFTSLIYLLVQFAIVANVVLITVVYPGNTWWFLLALIPYVFIFPKAAGIILRHHDNPDMVKKGAKLTVLIHLAFSLLLIVGFIVYAV